ncbi:MAG TPA: CARDB domain-containing protein [Actinomycetota bacterium]|nr:CARDB domain-containing protein [Actinomycetota bacterium]
MRVTSTVVCRSIRHVLTAAVVLAAAALPADAQPASSCALPGTTGFGDLTQGTTYRVGDAFSSGAAEFLVRPFTWSDGRTTEDGFASVDPAAAMAGGTGLELQVNNVLLDIGFGEPLESASLRFGDHGGNINLEVNGDPRNVDDLADLSGSTVDGVRVTVVQEPEEPTGILTLDGRIGSFAIGGQELWIDDVSGYPLCPDLAIADPSHRFEEQGRRLVVTASVENLGEVESPATAVALTREGWGVAREPVRSLQPADRTEVTLSLEVPPGAHGRTVSFVVRVDPDDVVPETDPTNNEVTIADVLVPAADMALTVGSIQVRDDEVVIPVVARNQGGLTSRPTTVVTTAEGWPATTAAVPRLAAGQEAALSLEVRIPADRRGETAAFVVTIDPDDVVRRELDESNNSTETSVEIPLLGDVASDTIDAAPWLPILLAAIASAVIVSFAAKRRFLRRSRRPRMPELSRLGLELHPSEPDVHVTARPDGTPRHTVRVILRSDRAREQVRERTLR